MEDIGVCLLINLNQEDKKIISQIIERSNCLEAGTIKSVNGGYVMLVDTKYYSAQIQLQVFNELEIASQWAENSKKPVLGLFIHCHIAQISARLLSQVRQVCRRIETGTKGVLVGGDCSAFCSQASLLQHFCSSEEIEQMELAPNKETLELLKEYHECWGIDRLWEVLESVDWPCSQLKTNPTNLPAHRKRLQHLIERLDRQPDKLRDPDFPDSDDEAAILEMFDKFDFGAARMIGNNYMGPVTIANIYDSSANSGTISKLTTTTNTSNSILNQSSLEESKKAKKKKSKKSKEKSPTEEDTEDKCSTAITQLKAITQQCSDDNVLSEGRRALKEILENVLKTSHGKDIKASSFDPTELDCGADDFSSVIGHLSELKEQGAALHRSERVSMAEKVSFSLLQKLGDNELEDGKRKTELDRLDGEQAKDTKKTV